jgi:hypothetical protein
MVGRLLNVALRLGLVAMGVETLRAAPDDPRFVDKGIGSRILVVGLPATFAIPALWLARGRDRGPYPVALDNLYLSIFTLDLAGNVFDLYDRYRHFDLIPHGHSAGAATVVVASWFRLPMLSAIGVVQIGHILLEAQEYYSDVLFGTRNVRGTWDTVGDLLAGIVGALAYSAIYAGMRTGAASRNRAARPMAEEKPTVP